MAKLTSLESKFSVSEPQSLKSTVNFKVSDDLKASLDYAYPSEAVGMSISGDSWSVGHTVKTQTTKLQLKRSLGDTKLQFSQTVPNNKWYLVPSLRIQATRGGLFGKRSTLQGAWDFQKRSGVLRGVVFSPGAEPLLKAKAAYDTDKGPTVALKARLGAGLLDSLQLKHTSGRGLRVSCRSKIEGGPSVKSAYNLQSQTLRLSAKHTPQPAFDASYSGKGEGRLDKLTVDLALPLGGKGGSARVVLGLKWLV